MCRPTVFVFIARANNILEWTENVYGLEYLYGAHKILIVKYKLRREESKVIGVWDMNYVIPSLGRVAEEVEENDALTIEDIEDGLAFSLGIGV